MLRITTTNIDEKVTLKLEGKLSGPWVEELERCWRTSTNISGKRRLVVDLSGVTFVDPAGKKLLCLILNEGAQLIGSGLMPKSLIDEICTEKAAEKSAKVAPKLKHQTLHLLLILLLPLAFARPTRAEDATPQRLTLHDAVAIALKENPQVQIGTLNFAESQED